MQSTSKQEGAVLMLMLLSLILAGAGTALGSRLNPALSQPAGVRAFSPGNSPGQSSLPLYLRAERDARVLSQAKVALLAYAVSYADNYGPTGAGPGHLPCPDLDPPDDGNPRNDGPNPPCSTASRWVGRMPRLTTADNRGTDSTYNSRKLLEFYPLQTHLDHQPWYRVAGSFVNNPANRVVNPHSVSRLQDSQQRPIVAALIAPGPELAARNQQRPSAVAGDYLEGSVPTVQSFAGVGSLTRDRALHSNDIVMPVYLHELEPLVVWRVAGFVRNELYRYRDTHCPIGASNDLPGVGVDVDVDVNTETPARTCFPFAAAPGELNSTAESTLVVNSTDDELSVCVPGLLTGRLSLVANACSGSLVQEGIWQGVAADRHWFVRNRWLNFFNYALDPQCLNDAAHLCRVDVALPQMPAPESALDPVINPARNPVLNPSSPLPSPVQISVVLPE